MARMPSEAPREAKPAPRPVGRPAVGGSYRPTCPSGARRGFGPALLFSCVLGFAGCTPPPAPPTSGVVPSAVTLSSTNAIVSTTTETLAPYELRQISDTQANQAYALGPDDVIAISVYGHPEFSVPAQGITNTVGGALITSDGSVALPLVGNIHLGGLTLQQAQDAVAAAYQADIRDPRVAVQLVHAESLSYYLLGAFTSPGIKYPVHQLNLLEALALGGSVDMVHADLYQAYVAQGATKLPVDLHALLVEGDLSQNIMLAAGDTIVVPSGDIENVFVFGAVGRPGAIPFQSGALSLLQAVASAGLDLPSYTDARLSQIRVIRAHGRIAQFFVVDAAKILSGAAAPFPLKPGDIVFVPPTLVATWNQVLAQLIPSLQVVSDSINPFVAIRYLETH